MREPRYTKDIDIWIEPSRSNAKKVIKALGAFGAPIDNLTVEDLAKPGTIYVFGIAPARVDILTRVKGSTFSTAWAKRNKIKISNQQINFVDLSILKKLKKAAGRHQDLADLEKLNKSK